MRNPYSFTLLLLFLVLPAMLSSLASSSLSGQATAHAQSVDELSRSRSQWEQMSDDEKQRCLKVFQQIQKMNPAARTRLIKQMKSLTSEQKSQLGKIVKTYTGENPEKRQHAKRAFRQRELWLKTQSPEDRQRFMEKDPELRKKHYAERLLRVRKHLLSKIPKQMLDEQSRKELLSASPEQFRQEFSRLIRAEISTVVSDRTFHLINDFESLDPPQIMRFIRRGEFPENRDDLRMRHEELDESEKRQFKGVLMKISRAFRMGKKPGPPHEAGRPHPPRGPRSPREGGIGPDGEAGKGNRLKPPPKSPGGPKKRRTRDGSPSSGRGPRPAPELEGASLEIRDQQA